MTFRVYNVSIKISCVSIKTFFLSLLCHDYWMSSYTILEMKHVFDIHYLILRGFIFWWCKLNYLVSFWWQHRLIEDGVDICVDKFCTVGTFTGILSPSQIGGGINCYQAEFPNVPILLSKTNVMGEGKPLSKDY